MKRYLWVVPVVALVVFASFVMFHYVPVAKGQTVTRQTNAPQALAEQAPEPEAALPLIPGVPGCLASPYQNVRAAANVNSGGSARCATNVSSVTHPSTGIYCVNLSSTTSTPVIALVTVEWGSSVGVVNFPQWNRFNTTCGGSVQSTIEVRTYKGDTGGVGSAYQIPVLSNEVAFSVLVP